MRVVTLASFLISLAPIPAAGFASAQDQILDLSDLTPEKELLTRVSGSRGTGRFGLPVAGSFDVDGDGIPDFAVAFMTASPLGRDMAGEVNLVFGEGAFGSSLDTAVELPEVLRIFGDGVREICGDEIWMGDVTGDGLGDLLIGRQNFDPGDRQGAGALTVVVGGPELRALAQALQPLDLRAPPPQVRVFTLVGPQPFARLGIWMRTGDVDGDGTLDFTVGADLEGTDEAQRQGAVYVVRGGAHLAQSLTVDLADRAASPLAGNIARIAPPAGSAGFHLGATCQMGDLDGNGRAEVMAAATLNRSGAFLGPVGASPASGGAPNGRLFIAWDDNFPAPPWPDQFDIDLANVPGTLTVLRGGQRNLNFGEEILGGLDYNGDGLPDLFVGDLTGDISPDRNRPASGAGYVFFNAALLRGLDLNTDQFDQLPQGMALTRLAGPSLVAIGSDTAAHGDFDGDGISDLMIGSPEASFTADDRFGSDQSPRSQAGLMHVIFGRASGWPEFIDTSPEGLNSPTLADLRLLEVRGALGGRGSDTGDTLCYSAASGDVDGDGRTDILVNEMRGNGVAQNAIDVGNLLVIDGRLLSPRLPSQPPDQRPQRPPREAGKRRPQRP